MDMVRAPSCEGSRDLRPRARPCPSQRENGLNTMTPRRRLLAYVKCIWKATVAIASPGREAGDLSRTAARYDRGPGRPGRTRTPAARRPRARVARTRLRPPGARRPIGHFTADGPGDPIAGRSKGDRTRRSLEETAVRRPISVTSRI